jgi:hypothetical protein
MQPSVSAAKSGCTMGANISPLRVTLRRCHWNGLSKQRNSLVRVVMRLPENNRPSNTVDCWLWYRKWTRWYSRRVAFEQEYLLVRNENAPEKWIHRCQASLEDVGFAARWRCTDLTMFRWLNSYLLKMSLRWCCRVTAVKTRICCIVLFLFAPGQSAQRSDCYLLLIARKKKQSLRKHRM